MKDLMGSFSKKLKRSKEAPKSTSESQVMIINYKSTLNLVQSNSIIALNTAMTTDDT